MKSPRSEQDSPTSPSLEVLFGVPAEEQLGWQKFGDFLVNPTLENKRASALWTIPKEERADFKSSEPQLSKQKAVSFSKNYKLLSKDMQSSPLSTSPLSAPTMSPRSSHSGDGSHNAVSNKRQSSSKRGTMNESETEPTSTSYSHKVLPGVEFKTGRRRSSSPGSRTLNLEPKTPVNLRASTSLATIPSLNISPREWSKSDGRTATMNEDFAEYVGDFLERPSSYSDRFAKFLENPMDRSSRMAINIDDPDAFMGTSSPRSSSVERNELRHSRPVSEAKKSQQSISSKKWSLKLRKSSKKGQRYAMVTKNSAEQSFKELVKSSSDGALESSSHSLRRSKSDSTLSMSQK